MVTCVSVRIGLGGAAGGQAAQAGGSEGPTDPPTHATDPAVRACPRTRAIYSTTLLLLYSTVLLSKCINISLPA